MLFQRSHRYSTASVTGLLMLAAFHHPASAASGDVINLESNSTSGNSIFAFRFNFTSNPTLISTTPAGGIEFSTRRSLSVLSIPIRISSKTPTAPSSLP